MFWGPYSTEQKGVLSLHPIPTIMIQVMPDILGTPIFMKSQVIVCKMYTALAGLNLRVFIFILDLSEQEKNRKEDKFKQIWLIGDFTKVWDVDSLL